MKIGIVGTGVIVKEFLPYLTKTDFIDVCAICGTPRSKETVDELCAQFKIPCGVTDFAKLLATDIDTVYIAVPNNLHYEFCCQALNAGKNVIVEKPITSSYSETVKLSNSARNKGLYLYEAVTTLYMPNYHKIRDLLNQIGVIKLVECNFSQYSRRYDAFREGKVMPVFDPSKSGGTLMDLNIYNINYAIGLLGEPNKVEYHANIERGIDLSGVAVMNYSDFKVVCIAAKDCSAPTRCLIQGTKGYIMQNTPPNFCGAVTLHLNDGTEQTFDESYGDCRAIPEFKEFARQIAYGDKTACYKMLDHSLIVSKVLQEARFSAGIYFKADEN